MIARIHHVAILTSNMEDAIMHFSMLLGCSSPRVFQADSPGLKFRSAMLPIGTSGETYLQFIEPSEGPGAEELSRDGEGRLFEVGFQVDDIEDFYERMVAKGIFPVDIKGQPIESKFIVSKFGNRYFFLPKDKTRGTRVEVVQVMGTGK